MVLDDSVRIPRVPTYSGYHQASGSFRLQGFHFLWLTFPNHSAINFRSFSWSFYPAPQDGLACSLFARRYLGNHSYFLFLQLLRCFNSLGFLLLMLQQCYRITGNGFPHSDTPGSLSVFDSPRLFADFCVLLRLQVPRHPPYALSNLIFFPYSLELFSLYLSFSNVFRFSDLLSYYLFLTIQKDIFLYLLFGFQRTISRVFLWEPNRINSRRVFLSPQKGGDPSPRSRRDTLLRLNPNHQPCLRRLPPCGQATGFGHCQLSWFDGRCVQDPRTYSPQRADLRLLAIPTSQSRVADSNPN